MAAMILQNPLTSGSAGAAPTFTMSDAPVCRPVQGLNKNKVAGIGVLQSLGNSQSQFGTLDKDNNNNSNSLEESDNSNTNSTNMSSQTGISNKMLSGREVSLDIEKVKNTYFMNANRKLLSPFISSNYSKSNSLERKEHVDCDDSNCTLDPPIRVSLNQTCCYPGDNIQGTVFCDLSEEITNVQSIGLSENNMLEDEVKLLVTFYGVERVSVVQENGEVSCKERIVFTKTKEVGSFKNVVHRNMYNFDFSFNLPQTAPPSCSIHCCNLGKTTGGLASITYSVVATLQGTVGIVSLQGNGHIIVREVPSNLKLQNSSSTTSLAALRSGNRNSAKLWRYLAVAGNPVANKNTQKNYSSHRISIPQRSTAHISLENDVIYDTGKIVINVDSARVKNGLVKAKRLSIKLIRRVEFFMDSVSHKWDKTILEQNVDIKSKIVVPLPCKEMIELNGSVSSELVENKYYLQIRAKPSFGVLGGNNVITLPIKIVAEDVATVWVHPCDGLCKRIKNIVSVPTDVQEVISVTDDETDVEGKTCRSPRVPVKLSEEKLLFVKSQAEREIIETKLVAVGIAKQQLEEAMNRALEAESELNETIKTISVEQKVKI